MLTATSNNLPEINPYHAQQQDRSVAEQERTKAHSSISEHTAEQKPHQDFSEEEQKQLQFLKSRDQEVKAHEQAHLSAAGGLALGGASFTYEKGADGVNYAVGGEVNIDTAAVPGDPEATLKKAETIRRAAMAPANPSSQDRAVASKASAMANQARAELFQANQKASENDHQSDSLSRKISFSV